MAAGRVSPAPLPPPEITMKTYEFWTLDGRLLAVMATDDPFSEIGELAQTHGVDADEIIWEAI